MSSDPRRSHVDEVAARLLEAVSRHYGPGARTDELATVLSGFATDRTVLDPGRLTELQSAAQQVFRHLELTTADGLEPQQQSPGWPPPDVTAIRRAGADVAAVNRDPDRTATIRLTGLATAEAAAPLLAGAFSLVRDAKLVVLDLRDNGGGDPATVALIVDWLAGGAAIHLFDVVYRDHVRQWWTAGAPLAPRPEGEVQALIGPRTASSGEALAWALHDQRLASLLGQPTRGAADHVVPLALTCDVHALIPHGRVVAPGGGPTWEGSGVSPDVTVGSAHPPAPGLGSTSP